MIDYIVKRDIQEKRGWDFDKMEIVHLKTGDYTIGGFEELLTIERKRTTGELAQNITDQRFDRELERMRTFKWPFMIFEFDMVDLLNFPENSGIPRNKWPELKIKPNFLLKKISVYQVKYPVKIIFASRYGKECADAIFREVIRCA